MARVPDALADVRSHIGVETKHVPRRLCPSVNTESGIFEARRIEILQRFPEVTLLCSREMTQLVIAISARPPPKGGDERVRDLRDGRTPLPGRAAASCQQSPGRRRERCSPAGRPKIGARRARSNSGGPANTRTPRRQVASASSEHDRGQVDGGGRAMTSELCSCWLRSTWPSAQSTCASGETGYLWRASLDRSIRSRNAGPMNTQIVSRVLV